MTEIQIRANQNQEILIGTEVNLDQVNKYNARTMGKWVILGGNAKVLRRRMKMILLILTKKVQDALLLTVDSPLDDWVLDSGASLHTIPH